MRRLVGLVMAMLGGIAAGAQPAAPPPKLTYAFTAEITLAPPVEYGVIEEKRRRFIAITGGIVRGPKLQGTVLGIGGDWQDIGAGGVTRLDTHYALRANDGTVIDTRNPGVRVASPEVTDKLARGVPVAPDQYYFGTTPRFDVAAGPHAWLSSRVFVGRGVRTPDRVMIDYYVVE
jgi:hypothetical protein